MENDKKYIFVEMVKHEEDISGMIAYSLYKFEKMKFIKNHKNIFSRELSQEELIKLQNEELKNIEKYKSISEEILENTINLLMQPSIDELNKQKEILDFERDKLNKDKEKFKTDKIAGFMSGVWQSIIASMILLFVSALIILSINYKTISSIFFDSLNKS